MPLDCDIVDFLGVLWWRNDRLPSQAEGPSQSVHRRHFWRNLLDAEALHPTSFPVILMRSAITR